MESDSDGKYYMKAAQQLYDVGQSLGLDNITCSLLTGGGLKRHINEFSVTGLTSNPTIFDHAIRHGEDYDAEIRERAARGVHGEDMFYEIALSGLRHATDLFRPIHQRTNLVKGWVSLEISLLLADDAAGTVNVVKELSARTAWPNLFLKIPGTRKQAIAMEQAIFAGVAVNVTLVFSHEQFIIRRGLYSGNGAPRRGGAEPLRVISGLPIRPRDGLLVAPIEFRHARSFCCGHHWHKGPPRFPTCST